jgi:hypothetical protein
MSTRERPPGTVADELHVALEAQRELSPEHEPGARGGVPRPGRGRDRQARRRAARRATRGRGDDGEAGVWLTIGSFAVGIPLTAVAGSVGLAGIIAVWTGIVLVNLAYWRR